MCVPKSSCMPRRLVLVLLVLFLLPTPTSGAQGFSLSPGDALFWKGPYVEQASGRTWRYGIRIERPAYRLRVGLDHAEVGDVYDVEIAEPGGRRYTFSTGTGLYSDEYAVRNPSTGTWLVIVRAEDVTESAFRMRAKLEARPPSLGTKTGPVLPNLQALPAHDPSFLLPVTNGSTDGDPQGIDLGGAESCHPEERVEEGAVRCLRVA